MKKKINVIPEDVIIDDDVKDFLCDYLETYGWYVDSNGYCVRTNSSNGKKKSIKLHRLIAGMYFGLYAINGKLIDHKNGNKLDNRISNLRICTQAENMRNREKQDNNSSGFKGVTWNKTANKWQAQITVNRKFIYLGLYSDKSEAARIYDLASEKHHKQFAKLNF
jgi:hypothetical protein